MRDAFAPVHLLHPPASAACRIFIGLSQRRYTTLFNSEDGGVRSGGWRIQVADLDGNGAADLFLHQPGAGPWFEVMVGPALEFTYNASR